MALRPVPAPVRRPLRSTKGRSWLAATAAACRGPRNRREAYRRMLANASNSQLRIASSLGLGRRFVAPALSELAARYPQLDIRLDVHDRLVDLVAEGVDLDIRVGNEIAANLIAKPLAKNRRVLCAAPAYLERRGTPRSLAELTSHDCLVIKERDHPFGVWHLEGPSGEENVKVTGPLSSNHGEVVHQWCLDGRGILLRSWWDVHDSLADGRLVQVLPEYQQQADIWAVHAAPLASSARVRVAVEFFRQYFAERYTLPES